MICDSASVYSKYLGDSERSIRQTFARARLLAPCLLICDDVDILGAKRGNDDRVNDRVIATLLTEMDGVSSGSGVFFVGSTSRVHNVDAALMRPGRFETVIELPQPKNLAQLLHDAEPFWLDIIASMQTEADARGRMLTPNDVKRVRLHVLSVFKHIDHLWYFFTLLRACSGCIVRCSILCDLGIDSDHHQTAC
jgi:AAA+ superfamily predicted ATPase